MAKNNNTQINENKNHYKQRKQTNNNLVKIIVTI